MKKKYILPTLCIVSLAQGMEVAKPTRGPQEWDAQAYAQGNRIQEEAALLFLHESGINFTNKTILDVGCGTGNITAMLAQTAYCVHGIDASKNMIEYAQTHENRDNLTFEHCFAEDFITDKKYDCALSIFCLHWIKDKQKAFESINKSLKINGEFFGTIFTSSDPTPLGIAVFKKLIDTLQPTCSFLQNTTMTPESSLNRYILSDEENKEIMEKSGLEIITYEKKSPQHIFKNREELAAFQRPVAMTRPIFKQLLEENREWLFNEYIDAFLAKLEKDENDHYVYQGNLTTVIHARKVAEIVQ